MEHGDDRKGDERRDPEATDAGGFTEHRFEEGREGGLAEGTEAQAREGDPELTCREVGVDVVYRVASRLRSRTALTDELLDLRGT